MSSESSPDYIAKDNLYSLYYELTSEIKGQKIELDEEEYEDNLRATPLNQIVNYVRESVMILLKKFSKNKPKLATPNETDINQYEKLLRKFEERQRNFIKQNFMHKLQREIFEAKIEEYMDMEDEFEEMKTKYKYEDGKFLDNDRKDNEILIIRAENTNLKSIIEINEKNVETMKKEIVNKDKQIKQLNEKIDKLMKQLEKTEKELNLFSNINININNGNNNNNSHIQNSNKHPNDNNNNHSINESLSPIANRNNNSNQISKCSFCTYNNNLSEIRGNSANQIKLLNLKNLKPSIHKQQHEVFSYLPSSNNKNHHTETRSTSRKNSHHRNNSMNMYLDKKKVDIISKYLSNKHKRTKTSLQTHNYKTNYNSHVNGNGVPLCIQQLTNRSCKTNRHSYSSLNQSRHNSSLGGIYNYSHKAEQVKTSNKKKTVLQKTTRQHPVISKKIKSGNGVQKGIPNLNYKTYVNYMNKDKNKLP
jgi:hypothetical protein